MINKLVIKNFQSHKLTILNLHPGVNCLIGSSDVGKSSIIRALRWLVWNRPQGKEFSSWWGGETCITAHVDSAVVDRIRDGSNNLYRLNDDDFKAIKAEVPVEIAQALNMNEINLQQQFDRPFLIDNSPGDVARHFNTIAKLDIIDIGLYNVESWRHGIVRNIEADQVATTSLEEQLKQFEGLEELDGKVQVLENLERTRLSIARQSSELNNIINTILLTKRELTEVNKVTKIGPQVDNVATIITQREQKQISRNGLQRFVDSILKTKQELTDIERLMDPGPKVDTIVAIISQRDRLHNKMQSLLALLADLTSTHIVMATQEQEVIKLHDRFDRVFPDVCPLCGSIRKLQETI